MKSLRSQARRLGATRLKARKSFRVRPQLDCLEDRVVLSITPAISGTDIVFTGQVYHEKLILSVDGGGYLAYQTNLPAGSSTLAPVVSTSLKAADVTSIAINPGSGDDKIYLDDAGLTPANFTDLTSLTVQEGQGNDIYYLGALDTTILFNTTSSTGWDQFVGNVIGDSQTTTLKATSDNAFINLKSGFDNGVDVIDVDNHTGVRLTGLPTHNTQSFSRVAFANVPASGVKYDGNSYNDNITTSLLYRDPKLTYDGKAISGPVGPSVRDTVNLAVTLEEAINNAAAIKADFDAAKTAALTSSTATLSNFFQFTITDFESVKLAVYNNGELLGLMDNMILGTANHDAGSPYTPVLNGTAQNDLILGFGGDDILNGLGGNDILVGGNGRDTINGGPGNDIMAFLGNETSFDNLTGDIGNDRVIAVQSGAVIGVRNLNGDIESFEGPAGTIIRADRIHSTLDFTNTAFTNIQEIDCNTEYNGGNDVVYVSTVSDANYRGGFGNDVFHLQGGKNVTLLYNNDSDGNGFDQFIDGGFTGTANAIAETAGTVIGLVAYNNQLDSIQGTGDTVVRAPDSVHDNLNFATTTVTGVASIATGLGDDTVTSALNAHDAGLTYDGGAYTHDRLNLAVTLEEAINNAAAIKADFDAAKTAALTSSTATLSNFFQFTIQNFESVKLAVYNNGELLGLMDNMILGTSNHDDGGAHPPVLNGTAQNDLILGFGGNDILNGLGGTDILVGGNGMDTINGGPGDDIMAFLGNETAFDNLSGDIGNDRVIAVQSGAVIGVRNLNGDIESFEGPAGTIIRSDSIHSTLDFTNSAFVGIQEIDGGTAGNDVIYVSTVSDATYRGNVGNDTFHLQGGKNVTLLYSGASNGFDQFIDDGYTGTATAIAETAGTVIGLIAYNDLLDSIQGTGDTIVNGSSAHDVFNFTTTTLTGVALIDPGVGSDTIYVSTVSDATYRGNVGNDTFHLQGGKNVTLLYSGASNGFDQFIDDGYTGTATAIAETAGTVIGLYLYNNHLNSIQGTGDTVVLGSDSAHDVFNFATTTLTGVALIDTGAGNDTITLSGLSACQYRGGTGNNTFVVPSAGSFEDQILDFDSTDKINYTLSGLGLPVITIEGADKVLTFSNGRKVRLTGYTGSVTLV